ncbi:MAG: TonB-dependent hemoglobin/transferrin/lactoferrin family receptor, partial [Puniceicoccales bacterium]|nr:TonB-dependent hemoglobin/transferrin/lactoferrin family receptor [Puniceicoccales bacterium]
PAPKSESTLPATTETTAPDKAVPDKKPDTTTEKKADMTIVVVATRLKESPYQVAGSSEAVTLDEAKEMGAVTLGDTLKYIPGVSVPFSGGANSTNTPYSSGGEKSINIRGLEDNRIAIMTDGIRQPDDFSAGTGSGFPAPGRIYIDSAVYSQVEIFKSASSSLYGSGALGGAIATTSVGPDQLLGPSLKGNVINNSFTYATFDNSANNLVQAASGNGEWAGSIVYSFRDGNEAETKGSENYNPMDYTSHAVIGKVTRKFAAVKLEATVDYYHRDEFVDAKNAEGSMNMGPVMKYEYFTADQDNTRERTRASLAAEIKPLDDVIAFDTVNIIGYWQDSKSRTRNDQLTKITTAAGVSYRDRTNHLDYETEITGFNAIAQKDIDSGFMAQTIQYGLDFSYSDVSSEFNRWDNTTSTNDPTVMAPSEVYRFGMFASDKVSLGEQKEFVLTPSVRVDYYNVNPDNTAEYMAFAGAKAASFVNWSVSPSFTGMYRITPDINVYGLYAMGTRNPSADELNGSFTHSGGGMSGGQFRTVPNPNLKDERSNNFELGFQGNTENHAFHIAGFYNMYDDFIESMYNTGTIDPDGYELLTSRNLDDVKIYGVEVSWHWKIQKQLIGLEGFRTGLSFAWTKGTQDTETNGHQPLSSVDPWKIVGYIGYVDPSDNWGIRLTGIFVGKKSDNDIAEFTAGDNEYDPVGSYFVMDLTGFYRINEHWCINVGINNLTDKEYTTWSSARATTGAGHSGTTYSQPGINGFVSLTATF